MLTEREQEQVKALCSEFDYQRCDDYDYCLRHNIAMPTDSPCPISAATLERLLASAWNAGASQGLRTPPHLGYWLTNPYCVQPDLSETTP